MLFRFKYREVKCCSFHKSGPRFLTVPESNQHDLSNSAPCASVSLMKVKCAADKELLSNTINAQTNCKCVLLALKPYAH
jgi:hypothetical protein